MIDFIGLGAQKSGTSWVHACLYEHPEICSPVKEIHFFSRPRFTEGQARYEKHWQNCKDSQRCGEFSTSYLYSPVAAKRIADWYLDIRLIAIVRNPATRAYSQYRNAIKGGEISEDIGFGEYQNIEPSCLEQGLYYKQLTQYWQHFSKEQFLVLVYEDIVRDPLQFIQTIYRHVGVDDTFVPPSLNTQINVARTPKNFRVDKRMHYFAEWLRRHGADALVYTIKRFGIPELIRRLNTKTIISMRTDSISVPKFWRMKFRKDAMQLGEYLNRDIVTEWKL